ncbi:MAG: class I SAM-dependent methyltransferase [Nitrospirae bacterium]|nr:class I SAM-dependent methyltransferase [Nitrospirota bacterium]
MLIKKPYNFILKIISTIKNAVKSFKDMSSLNKETFNAIDTSEYYALQSQLQKPEQTLLIMFKDDLKNMKMLDIGVGGGRTTCNFAKLTKEYIGIDYSENMIKMCRERFKDYPDSVSFEVCDVRSMSGFADHTFDFVLFSFNGIDCISHEDRIKSFHEIKRICKKGAIFYFSSHNLQSIHKLFAKISRSDLTSMWKLREYLLLRLLNRDAEYYIKKKHAVINEGLSDYRIKLYYIKPKEQIQQLHDAGFNNIRIFSLEDGREITESNELDAITDDWIYYLCYS